MIKHSFETHSMEPMFRLVCGIRGCTYSFKVGSTFSSFKTHASRKHPNWQSVLKESDLSQVPSSEPPINLAEATLTEQDCLNSEVDDPSTELPSGSIVAPAYITSEVQIHVPRPCVSAKRSAALLLLTFQERYRLSQTAVNFMVGSVSTIVDNVCDSLQEAVQSSLQKGHCTVDVAACFDVREDPFAQLQTEYKQTKFYQKEFGLVVSNECAMCARIELL